MRNLAFIMLLFIGVSDPPDSVKVDTTEIRIEQEAIQADMDTIKIMLEQLKNTLKKDTLK